MLKLYYERAHTAENVPSVTIVAPVSHVGMDDAVSKFERTARLKNSEMLNIEQMLSYLPDQQRQDIILLIKQYPPLFADAPSDYCDSA